jgi:hypothetical protein
MVAFTKAQLLNSSKTVGVTTWATAMLTSFTFKKQFSKRQGPCKAQFVIVNGLLLTGYC